MDLFYTTILKISTGGPSAGNQLEGHQQNIMTGLFVKYTQ